MKHIKHIIDFIGDIICIPSFIIHELSHFVIMFIFLPWVDINCKRIEFYFHIKNKRLCYGMRIVPAFRRTRFGQIILILTALAPIFGLLAFLVTGLILHNPYMLIYIIFSPILVFLPSKKDLIAVENALNNLKTLRR